VHAAKANLASTDDTKSSEKSWTCSFMSSPEVTKMISRAVHAADGGQNELNNSHIDIIGEIHPKEANPDGNQAD